VVGITDKENGQVPRAFVVLRPGFEETEENVTNLMESRLGVSKVETIWFPSSIPVRCTGGILQFWGGCIGQ
jgi:long-chain acyl-CoA synthetase